MAIEFERNGHGHEKDAQTEVGASRGAAGRRRSGCHQQAGPSEGNRNPRAPGMLAPGAEEHHQRNPRRRRIGNRECDGKERVRRRRLGSAQNQEGRRGKTGEEERQKETP